MSENPINAFLDRARSFAASRAAIAALELDVFPALEHAAKTPAALAEELRLSRGPITDIFFDLLVTSGFLERDGDALALSAMSRASLASYDSIQSWGHEMRQTYRCLDDFERLVQTGAFEETEVAQFWPYKTQEDRSDLDPATVEDYSQLMDASQEKTSEHIAQSYDFGAHGHVIDFGGGYARLAMTLAERYPELRVTVADLDVVCRGARERIEAAGLSSRVECLPCDFLEGPLPESVAGAVLFCRVLHDWQDADVATLLERTRRCLEPGGVVIAVEPMFDDNEPLTEGSLPAALMLALLGGQRRSVQAYQRLFEEAGYRDITWHETGQSIWRLVVGHL